MTNPFYIYSNRHRKCISNWHPVGTKIKGEIAWTISVAKQFNYNQAMFLLEHMSSGYQPVSEAEIVASSARNHGGKFPAIQTIKKKQKVELWTVDDVLGFVAQGRAFCEGVELVSPSLYYDLKDLKDVVLPSSLWNAWKFYCYDAAPGESRLTLILPDIPFKR